jgi:hypothetical protein
VAVYEILVNLEKKSEWNSQFGMLDVVEEVDAVTKVAPCLVIIADALTV